MILSGLPQWLELLIAGLLILYFMIVTGIVATRAGYSPLWVLLLLIPYVQIIVIWFFACKEWPAHKKALTGEDIQ